MLEPHAGVRGQQTEPGSGHRPTGGGGRGPKPRPGQLLSQARAWLVPAPVREKTDRRAEVNTAGSPRGGRDALPSGPQLRVVTPPLRPQGHVTEMRPLGHRGTWQGLGVSLSPMVDDTSICHSPATCSQVFFPQVSSRMSPARCPYRGGCIVGPHVPAASAPVRAWPLPELLAPVSPHDSALHIITEHPWGLLQAQEGLRGRGSKGEAGSHHKEAGKCLPVGGTALADPAAFSSSSPHLPPTSASEDCLWGDQQEVQA